MCESFALRDSKKKIHRNLALTDSSYDMFAFRDSRKLISQNQYVADKLFVRYICAA